MSLKHSILALLFRKPKTGYDLSKQIQGSTGFFWTATHQQIYKNLAELQELGFVRHKEVEQDDKPDKKIYSTTKEGIAELKHWLTQKTEPGPTKDPFLIKLFVGDLTKPEILLEDLLSQKESHLTQRRKYTDTLKEHFNALDNLPLLEQYQYLSLRRGITFENAWLSWCKEVEEFLNQRIQNQ